MKEWPISETITCDAHEVIWRIVQVGNSDLLRKVETHHFLAFSCPSNDITSITHDSLQNGPLYKQESTSQMQFKRHRLLVTYIILMLAQKQTAVLTMKITA